MYSEKFWLALAFVTFIAILWKLAGKLIIKLIDDKSSQIASDIELAKQSREKAEKALEKAEKYLKESEEYSKQLIINAQKEAEDIVNQANSSTEDEIAKKMDAKHKRIHTEEQALIREVKREIIRSSIETIIANVNEDLTDEENKKLINSSIKDLGGIIN